MDEGLFFLDPCPDSVWMQLPGGPVATDDVFGESWQYMGSARRDGEVRHEFRHRAHPDYGNARVYAHVADHDAGPRLRRLVADGRELPLAPIAVRLGGDIKEEVEDLASP
jgi:hypothetical protein